MHPKDLASERVLVEYRAAEEKERDEIFLRLWHGIKRYENMPDPDAVVAQMFYGPRLQSPKESEERE
jgi:uncharacterized protein YbaA (DUF1428 family)